MQIKRVVEEEWSYIPVGGPLPVNCQPVTAFGAAANLIHPATGYSIVRSLREAPELAKAMAEILKKDLTVAETSARVWDALWPQEKRRQVMATAQKACNSSKAFAQSRLGDVFYSARGATQAMYFLHTQIHSNFGSHNVF